MGLFLEHSFWDVGGLRGKEVGLGVTTEWPEGRVAKTNLACFTAMPEVVREALKNISIQRITQGLRCSVLGGTDLSHWTFSHRLSSCGLPLGSVPLRLPGLPPLSPHLIFSSCSANLFLFTKPLSCYLFYYHISRGTFLDFTDSILSPSFLGGQERAESLMY